MEKTRVIKLLAKAYAIEILKALNGGTLRFIDLKGYCPNDRTRAMRLKELKRMGFIITIIKEVKEHNYIHYQITEKGRKAFELVNELENL